MTYERKVLKPSTVSTEAGDKTRAQTHSAPVEVVSRQLDVKPAVHSGSIFMLPGGGGGGGGPMMYPQHVYTTDQSQAHGYVGVGVIVTILLAVFGCIVFRFCKNRVRRSAQQEGERRGPDTATSNGQEATSYEQEDASHDVSEHHSSVSSDAEEGELRFLTESIGMTTPARYCIIPHTDHHADTSVTKDDTDAETSFTDPVAETNGTACTEDTKEAVNVEGMCLDTRQTETVGDVEKTHRAGNINDVVIVAPKDEGFHTDNTTDLTSCSGHQASCYSHRSQTGTQTYDKGRTLAAADTELSPQPDSASDESEYLATLMLEVSPQHSDVTEGDRTHGSSSRATDDSLQSFESFTRLQDVKAQAEFSPYHIAWSTPLFAHHSSLRLRQSQKVPAAKKLNMDAAGRKPSDSLPQNSTGRTELTSTDSLVDTAKRHGDCASAENVTLEPTEPLCWGFLKPPDAWCRPASIEFRTPRPQFYRDTHVSLGSLVDANEDNAVREHQPLLPYSVAEYRRSLKNVSLARDSTSSPKETLSPEQLNTSCDSSLSSQSSTSHPTYLFRNMDACRKVLTETDSSLVQSGQNEEHTLQNLANSAVACNMDSTLSGVAEITHSSLGDRNSSVVSVSWNNGGCQNGDPKKQSHDSVKNSARVETVCGNKSRWFHGQPTSPSSLPFTITSPSRLMSSGADYRSMTTTSSSDRLSCFPKATSRDQLCPESDLSQGGTDSNESSVLSRGLSTLSKPSSQDSLISEAVDTFKVPYPLPSASSFSVKGGGKRGLPRSKSSTHRPLAHGALWEPGRSQLRRSRTSESICSSMQHLQHPPSLGSWGDISTAGSFASCMSLQDPSLTWDNEFTASGRGHDDSLTWEDDPYLT